MAKKTVFTKEWLESRGLVESEKNVYIPTKSPKSNVGTDFHDVEMIIKGKVNDSPDFQVKPVTEWFIQGYNVPSKKNSRQNFVRNGKQISIRSKIHANYVKMTAMQYSVFGKEFRKSVESLGLLYPLKVQFTFVRDSHRRFDYCNACQTCEDLMVSNNWLDDDSANHLLPIFTPYEYDKNNPGVKIKILY